MTQDERTRGFVRHDLMAPDPARSIEFLRPWLPWTFGPGPDRRGIRSPAGPVGQVIRMNPGNPATPHWLSLAAVPDLGTACERIGRMGGRVTSPPSPLPGAGWVAVCTDPDGNIVGLMEESERGGYPIPPGSGDFARHLLSTPHPELALPFYAEVMGWDIHAEDRTSGPRWTARLHGTVAAEIERHPRDEDRPSGWYPYVLVENVDRSFRLAWEVGARPVVRPHDLPGPGRAAVLADPDGAVLGLFQWAAVR